MILSFDEAGAWLDDMYEAFPACFFKELNGGVALLPDVMRDPEFPDGDPVYFMGDYCDDMLGKHIDLYYGSFAALAETENWTEEDWEDELWTTLAHELTHHVEGLAMVGDLDEQDAAELAELRRRLAEDESQT